MHEMQTLESKTCPTISNHKTTVSVPVCISPFAVPGPASIECCGNPEISSGYDRCCGTINGGCEFTLSQTMKIDIPVVFGASIRVGDAYVDCNAMTGSLNGDCSCHYTELEAEVQFTPEADED